MFAAACILVALLILVAFPLRFLAIGITCGAIVFPLALKANISPDDAFPLAIFVWLALCYLTDKNAP